MATSQLSSAALTFADGDGLLACSLTAGSSALTSSTPILLPGAPAETLQAATKGYVDSVAEGLHVKAAVRAATTANGTFASAFANGQTVDGVTLATGDRILIKNQTDAVKNGIYTVKASGAPDRAVDFNADDDITAGAFTFVEEGTENADKGWVLITDGTITIETTPLAFTQFSSYTTTLASLGVTATASELNTLDGVTATTAEINILDGVTATTAELNILDGVTASTTELNILDGVTATTA